MVDNNKEVIALVKELDAKYEELRTIYNTILTKRVIVDGVETEIDMAYNWELGNFNISTSNYPDEFENGLDEMTVDSDDFIWLLGEK